MPGAGLSYWRSRRPPLENPAFQPYWGKPAVRNDRGDRGNVGIIRSPIRASILPDCGQGDGLSPCASSLRQALSPLATPDYRRLSSLMAVLAWSFLIT